MSQRSAAAMQAPGCEFGVDIAAWASVDYAQDDVIDIKHRADRRTLERLQHTGFVAVTHTAVLVKDATSVFKVYRVDPERPKTDQLSIWREILLGAALCERPVAGVVGITQFWTFPHDLSGMRKISPLSQDPFVRNNPIVQNDWTQLLPPATALRARYELVKYDVNEEIGSKHFDKNRLDRLNSIMERILDRTRPAIPAAAFSEYLAPQKPPPVRIMAEQPKISGGLTLHIVLLRGNWEESRPLLRATIARLAELQASIRFQHGDLSGGNVMIENGAVAIIDLARAWCDAAVLQQHNIAPITHAMVPGFDLRFLGVWLAWICVRNPSPKKLRWLAAALVAPSKAMVDALQSNIVALSKADRYAFHRPRSASYRDYVANLTAASQWLLIGSDDMVASARVTIDTLLYDLGPWTRAIAMSNCRAVIDDPLDLCRPENALRLDLLLE